MEIDPWLFEARASHSPPVDRPLLPARGTGAAERSAGTGAQWSRQGGRGGGAAPGGGRKRPEAVGGEVAALPESGAPAHDRRGLQPPTTSLQPSVLVRSVNIDQTWYRYRQQCDGSG